VPIHSPARVLPQRVLPNFYPMRPSSVADIGLINLLFLHYLIMGSCFAVNGPHGRHCQGKPRQLSREHGPEMLWIQALKIPHLALGDGAIRWVNNNRSWAQAIVKRARSSSTGAPSNKRRWDRSAWHRETRRKGSLISCGGLSRKGQKNPRAGSGRLLQQG